MLPRAHLKNELFISSQGRNCPKISTRPKQFASLAAEAIVSFARGYKAPY